MQALGNCGVWLETLLDIFVLGLVDVGDSLAIQEQRSGCGLVSHLLKYVVVLVFLPSDPQPHPGLLLPGQTFADDNNCDLLQRPRWSQWTGCTVTAQFCFPTPQTWQ